MLRPSGSIAVMGTCNSGKDAAEEFKLTPGRVTQLRQKWCLEWKRRQE
jgi:hypothetical protein